MGGTVRCEIDGGVAVLTIDNPPANALSTDVFMALEAATIEAECNPAARAVVIASAGGKAFVAGGDITEFRQRLEEPEAMASRLEWTGGIYERIAQLEVPVFAAVQAVAVGGGVELTLLCDIVVADERARFGFGEVKLGLIPGGGGTQRLARRVSAMAALELVLLGDLVDAQEARRLGLVNRVVPAGKAFDTTYELASRVAALPAVAVRAAKRALRQGLELPLPDGIRYERQCFLEAFASRDFREGLSAFLDRRPPRFTHA